MSESAMSLNCCETDKRLVIGIDFDNTVITYDSLIYDTAVERGLVCTGIIKSKREIRDAIRKLPEGEIRWQELQAYIYGLGISKATLVEGIQPFIRLCRQKKIPV